MTSHENMQGEHLIYCRCGKCKGDTTNIDVLWKKYSLPDYPNGKRSMSRSRFVQAISEIIQQHSKE